jgi:WD40 repeat protein
LATGGWDGPSSTLIWDQTTGQRRRILAQDPKQGLWGRSVDFSPDGKLVAGEEWDDVFVWSIDDAGIVARMREQQVTALAFSPDGRRLATGSLEGELKMWEARTGRQLNSLTGNLGQVPGYGLLSGWGQAGDELIGRHCEAVGRWHGTADSRSLAEWRERSDRRASSVSARACGVPRGGGKLAFSPDGTRLAYTAADGTVRVLALDIDDLIQLARSRLTRSWRQDECETYLNRDTCSDS